jgi:hypothetical protein
MLHKSSNFTYKPLNRFAMKSPLLVLAVAALALGSCTSAYKTGQTPDDVYFSPTRPQEEYVQTEKREDRRYHGTDEYYEDRYLRMRVTDRYRWSVLDDYYLNSPYAYNYYGSYYGNTWSNPYNSYWCWNNYYNPYSSVIIIKNPKSYVTPPSRPVAFNAASYNSNPGTARPSSNRYVSSYYNNNNNNNGSRYNNSNSSSSFSNTLRKTFSNSNSESNNSYQNNNSSSSTPSRSYNPSSSSSSSSSSSNSSRSSSSSSGSSSGGRPNR